MEVLRHASADAFLGHALGHLTQREAENCVIIGVATTEARSEPPATPSYLAVVEEAGSVVGAALRTPPHKLFLSPMPTQAVAVIVADVAPLYPDLPAVDGPVAVASAFADLWSRRTGLVPRRGMETRVYELTRVLPPPPCPGHLRVAQEADVDRVGAWMERFTIDAGIKRVDGRKVAEPAIAQGRIRLWEADEVVSMAGCAGPTPRGIRVNYVYTPPERRGRGYASSCVAAFSQELLDGGRQRCFLFTDLANPASNAIYQRIGYRPVADFADFHF